MNDKHQLIRFLVSFLPLLVFSLPGCSSRVNPATVISGDNKSYAVTATNGLRLTLSISSTTFKSGDTVFAFIDEWNTKTTRNNVSTASAAGILLSGYANSLNPNGTGLYYFTYPIGISVWQGDYDLAEVSSIRPLTIQNPSDIKYGPAIPVMDSYDFQPLSDVATFLAQNPNDLAPASLRVTGSISPSGFWGTGLNSFHNFPPGTYTVVGGDMWGAIAILHFTVS